MPRSTPQAGWHDARQSKPSQGDRVILRIRDEECPAIGYWSGYWEVCTVNVKSLDGSEIEASFDQSDVTDWHIIPE